MVKTGHSGQEVGRYFLLITNNLSELCRSVEGVFTCREVMDPLWPCSTATGAQVRRHHTRMVLSQLPAAISVFS